MRPGRFLSHLACEKCGEIWRCEPGLVCPKCGTQGSRRAQGPDRRAGSRDADGDSGLSHVRRCPTRDPWSWRARVVSRAGECASTGTRSGKWTASRSLCWQVWVA